MWLARIYIKWLDQDYGKDLLRRGVKDEDVDRTDEGIVGDAEGDQLDGEEGDSRPS